MHVLRKKAVPNPKLVPEPEPEPDLAHGPKHAVEPYPSHHSMDLSMPLSLTLAITPWLHFEAKQTAALAAGRMPKVTKGRPKVPVVVLRSNADLGHWIATLRRLQ